MNSQINSYQVYIIRAWLEESVQSERVIVRFVLEVAGKNSRRGFGNSAALLSSLGADLAQIEDSRDESEQNMQKMSQTGHPTDH